MKHIILEKFKSKILSDLFNTNIKNSRWKADIEKHIFKTFNLKLDKITDDMVTKIEGNTLKKIRFDANNKICFWFSVRYLEQNFSLRTPFIGMSLGKKMLQDVGEITRSLFLERASFKKILEICDLVYIIDIKKAEGLGGVRDLIKKRLTSKDMALALKDAEQIRKENILRYNRIIKEKKIKDTDTDKKVKLCIKKLEDWNKDYILHPETWKKFAEHIRIEDSAASISSLWRSLLGKYSDFVEMSQFYLKFDEDEDRKADYLDRVLKTKKDLDNFCGSILSGKKMEMTPEDLKDLL